MSPVPPRAKHIQLPLQPASLLDVENTSGQPYNQLQQHSPTLLGYVSEAHFILFFNLRVSLSLLNQTCQERMRVRGIAAPPALKNLFHKYSQPSSTNLPLFTVPTSYTILQHLLRFSKKCPHLPVSISTLVVTKATQSKALQFPKAAGEILPFLWTYLPAWQLFSLSFVLTKPVRKTETEAEVQPFFFKFCSRC